MIIVDVFVYLCIASHRICVKVFYLFVLNSAVFLFLIQRVTTVYVVMFVARAAGTETIFIEM